MKRIILILSLFLFGINCFGQDLQENGTIYIKAPYIDSVNDAIKAYLAKDDDATMQIYSDTAKVWYQGMEKPMSIADAVKMWDTDFDNYDNVQMKTVGYPDYLHYTDRDQKVVQSWWHWSGTSKKTGKVVNIDMVTFDYFNDDGKIVMELDYGNFPPMAVSN